MEENFVSVKNNDAVIIKLDLINHNPKVDLDFVDSWDSALSVHNSSQNAHSELFESVMTDLNKSVTNVSLLKVDKEEGKGLSKNDLSDDLKINYDFAFSQAHAHSNFSVLELTSGVNTGDQDLSNAATANMPSIANSLITPATQINFSSGFCYDLATGVKIVNTSMVKKLDEVFIQGSANGGLDSGVKMVSTWYHCFAISKNDGTSDFLFSKSIDSPILPTGFVNKRRIGTIRTDSSGLIRQFYQKGSYFWFSSPVEDTVPYASSYVDYVVSAPPKTIAIMTARLSKLNVLFAVKLKSKVVGGAYYYLAGTNSTPEAMNNSTEILVDSESKIQYACEFSACSFGNTTLGYIDNRGAN